MNILRSALKKIRSAGNFWDDYDGITIGLVNNDTYERVHLGQTWIPVSKPFKYYTASKCSYRHFWGGDCRRDAAIWANDNKEWVESAIYKCDSDGCYTLTITFKPEWLISGYWWYDKGQKIEHKRDLTQI